MMFGVDDVSETIERSVSEALGSCSVGVNISRDLSDKDSPVLRIMVVIETDCDLDKKKMLGLVRRIRSDLSEMANADGFPMLSFVSRSDATKLGLEFA